MAIKSPSWQTCTQYGRIDKVVNSLLLSFKAQSWAYQLAVLLSGVADLVSEKALFWCLHWTELPQSKLELSGWSEQTHLKGRVSLIGKQPQCKDKLLRRLLWLCLVWIQPLASSFKSFALGTCKYIQVERITQSTTFTHHLASTIPTHGQLGFIYQYIPTYYLLPLNTGLLRSKATDII